MEIEVHPFSNNPTRAWKEISKGQIFKQITPKIEEKARNHVRVVCMSDTHSRTDEIKFKIPQGDIFIHAGDFTKFGQVSEIHKFNKWISKLHHRFKIVIAGNHEITFDSRCTENLKTNMLKNCIYLEDSWIELYGLKIYGSPWQPEHMGMAFELPRGRDLLEKWNLIPDDTDILITHGPPVGYGDTIDSGEKVGCVELLSTVQKRIKSKYHIFGHIHEGYGITTDGVTIFINAATCDTTYSPINPPIVFDIPISKQNKTCLLI